YQAGMEYLRRVSGSDENLIDQLRSYQNQLDTQTQRLVEASGEQEVLLAELVEMAGQLQDDLSAAESFHSVLVAQKAAEDEERRRLEAERLRREQEERERSATSTTTPTTVGSPTTAAQQATTTTQGATTTTSGGTTSTTS